MASNSNSNLIVDQEGFNGLQNHAAIIKKKKAEGVRAMLNHVKKMLEMFPIEISPADESTGKQAVYATTLDELPESVFERNCEFLGKFSAYLKDHARKLKHIIRMLNVYQSVTNT